MTNRSIVPYQARPLLTRRLFQDNLFDRLFEDLLAPWQGRLEPLAFDKPMDVREEDDRYVVSCELPGYDPKDVKVELAGDVLTIKAEVDETSEEGKKKARRYSSFCQCMTLGGVDADQVKAEHENGILTVTLPKSATARARRIDIQAGPKQLEAKPVEKKSSK